MLKAKKQCFRCLIALVIGILFCVDFGTAADKSFFNNKVIELIVATKPGGGFDTDARLVAPYLQKELPGSTVIIRNVPGAGHIVATNRIWNAPPNGLTIGFANVPGLIAGTIRGEEGMQFDLRKFTWLGRLYSKHRFLIARKNSGFDTIEALMKNDKEFKLGSDGVGAGPYNTGKLAASALGLTKVHMITSYGSSAEVFFGVMRKEVDGTIGTLESFGELIEQGVARVILLFDLKRWEKMPNVPTLTELVKTNSGKAAAAYISSEGELIRAIFTSPNLPNDTAQTLRTAIMRALQNENLKTTVAKMNMAPFDPLSGEETAKKVASALSMPSDVAKLIKESGKTL